MFFLIIIFYLFFNPYYFKFICFWLVLFVSSAFSLLLTFCFNTVWNKVYLVFMLGKTPSRSFSPSTVRSAAFHQLTCQNDRRVGMSRRWAHLGGAWGSRTWVTDLLPVVSAHILGAQCRVVCAYLCVLLKSWWFEHGIGKTRRLSGLKTTPEFSAKVRSMSRTDQFIFIIAWCQAQLLIVSAVRCSMILLLITPDVTSGDEFRFNIYQYRMFLNDDSDEIYVGGDQVLLKVDVNDYRVIQVGVFVCLLFFVLCYTLIKCSFSLGGLNKCLIYCVDSDNFLM